MQFKGLPSSQLLHSLNPSAKPSTPVAGAKDPGRQQALQQVNDLLAKAYERLGLKGAGEAPRYGGFEPLTAEKVAGNILGFIERRLMLDAAEGATREQLESRLEAGLAGFKKGFAEASEQLKALSMLSPGVKQDIGKTYDLVIEGIDALRKRFIDTLPEIKPALPEPSSRSQSSYLYASASSFSFELTTAEGDKVTIQASVAQAQAAEYRTGEAGKGFWHAAAENSHFTWQVEGDLNEDETRALEDLLSRINSLADSFFRGDLDSAFQQALDLEYDPQQIVAFSLNLTQIDVQKVSSTYRQVADSPVAGLTGERLLPLGHFLRDLQDTLAAGERFPQLHTLLAELSERVVVDTREQNETESPAVRFRAFVEQVLAALESGATQAPVIQSTVTQSTATE